MPCRLRTNVTYHFLRDRNASLSNASGDGGAPWTNTTETMAPRTNVIVRIPADFLEPCFASLDMFVPRRGDDGPWPSYPRGGRISYKKGRSPPFFKKLQ